MQYRNDGKWGDLDRDVLFVSKSVTHHSHAINANGSYASPVFRENIQPIFTCCPRGRPPGIAFIS